MNWVDPEGLIVGVDDAAIIAAAASLTALTAKMELEISRLRARDDGPDAIMYSLRASEAGFPLCQCD